MSLIASARLAGQRSQQVFDTLLRTLAEPGTVHRLPADLPQEVPTHLWPVMALADVDVTVDPDRYHALDAPLIVGDPSRLRDETGWSPRFAFRKTLADLLEDWRRTNPRRRLFLREHGKSCSAFWWTETRRS